MQNQNQGKKVREKIRERMRRLRGWKDELCHGGWAACQPADWRLVSWASRGCRVGASGEQDRDGLLDTQHGGKAAPAARYPVCSISRPQSKRC